MRLHGVEYFMGTIETVVSIGLMQVFYGVAISLFLLFIPVADTNQLGFFSDNQGISQLTTMQTALEGGMRAQSTIPFVDFGSLIFYSSITGFNIFMNILIAIPAMLSILLTGLFLLIPVPDTVANIIRIGFIGICTVLYYLMMFVFIISTRSPTYGGI